MASLCLFPLGPDAVRVKWTLSFHEFDFDPERVAERIPLWEAVNREDREKLERMQPALRSAYATGGPLAGPDYEGTVRDFLTWMADELPEG